MRPRFYLLLALLPSLAVANSSQDNLDNHLEKFLKKYNTSANVSKSEVYNGQRAGYATGGSIVIRNRANIVTPATINLPKIDAGCGGIDIYAGGLSFVNRDELVNTLKDIGGNSVGYAFLLGLDTLSPQISNTIRQLQSWSNQINQVGINSCEVAAQLTGAVWPANTGAKERICQIATANQYTSDFISGRQKCGTVEKQQIVNDELVASNPSLLVSEYNIAWEALKTQSFISQEAELMEMMMTLLGTIIIRQDGSGFDDKAIYPAKIDDDVYYKTLLTGGTVPIYRCTDKKDKITKKDKCLTVDLKSLALSPKDAWVGRIQRHLENIQYKILHENSGEKLNDAEIEMMTKTRLPLFHIVNVLTAYRQGECSADLNEVAEIVAVDLLMQFLRDAVLAIKEGCEKLREQQIYSTNLDGYLDNVYRAQDQLKYFDIKEKTIEREYHLLKKVEAIEEKVIEHIKLF